MAPEPLLRLFAKEGVMQEVSTEGIVAAPESNHAVKAAIDLALECKWLNEEKTILFNLSGHGLLDMNAYEDKLAARLIDYEPDAAYLSRALETVPTVP